MIILNFVMALLFAVFFMGKFGVISLSKSSSIFNGICKTFNFNKYNENQTTDFNEKTKVNDNYDN